MADQFGERPRPWVLVYGVAPDDEFRRQLSSACPTIRFLEGNYEYAGGVRQTDYDLLIIKGSVQHEPAHGLNILQFGDHQSGEVHPERENGERFKAFGDGVSELFTGPDDSAPDTITASLTASLAEWLIAQGAHCRLSIFRQNNTSTDSDSGVTSFVRERDGLSCAGRWMRPDSESEWWWLPDGTPRALEWVMATIRHLATVQPARFPGAVDADWRQDPSWMSHEEVVALQLLQGSQDEMRRVVAQQQEIVDRRSAELLEARSLADSSTRRLLTAQSDELKSAVADALSFLEFTVTDSDTKRQEAGAPLLEDLQVGVSTGTAIVEVRGYSKSGGKTHDLLRLSRAAVGFEKEFGQSPAARWYVVNHSFTIAPDGRPAVLQGSDDDVDEFAMSGGLVVDTRDLFRLIRDAASGAISKESARSLLDSRTGRFAYPEAGDEAGRD